MTRADAIEQALRTRLAPAHLSVVDESAAHAGHAGAAGGGGHFRILVVAAAFRGQDAVSRHRLVYAALGDSMRAEIHAVALQTFTPEEWDARSQ